MAKEDRKNAPATELHDESNARTSPDAADEAKELDADSLEGVSAGYSGPRPGQAVRKTDTELL